MIYMYTHDTLGLTQTQSTEGRKQLVLYRLLSQRTTWRD